MFGEHEAAGAIPVIPTKSESSKEQQTRGPLEARSRIHTSRASLLASALQVPSHICRRCEDRDTILRRSMVEVRILPAAPALFHSCRRREERDTILRRSLVEVRFLPAAPCGPRSLGYRNPTSKLGDPKGFKWTRASNFVRIFLHGPAVRVTDLITRVRQQPDIPRSISCPFYVEVW